MQSNLGPRPAVEELAIPQAQDEEMEEFDGADIPGGDDEPNPGRDLQEQMVHYEIGVALPEEIRVNEVPLTVDSPPEEPESCLCFLQDRTEWRQEKMLQSASGSSRCTRVDDGQGLSCAEDRQWGRGFQWSR